MLLLVSAQSHAHAAVYKARGQVIDSITGDPVSYAVIEPLGSFTTVLADDNGRFSVNTPRTFTRMRVSAMGFTPDTITVTDTGHAENLTIYISSTGIALGEVIAKPRKEKYSKHNNPAVEFVKRIAHMDRLTDPMRNPFYNYDRYERITLALNNVTGDHPVLKGMPQLKNYVDTSDISGLPILNVSVKERFSEHHLRSNPHGEKVYITGINRTGIDDIIDQGSVQTLLDDVLREIDVYDDNINILQNRFVSPLSKIAPDFYKFYLMDTVMVDGVSCIELAFVPRTPQSFGFTGHFYVPENDSTMFIKKIVMNVPHDINLNFISHLYINQEFEKAPDGSRLKTRDDMTAEVSVLTAGFYARRNTAYTNHNFRRVDESMFDDLNKVEETPIASRMPPFFWQQHRLIPMPRGERKMSRMVRTLRDNKVYYWAEKIVKVLGTGYINTGNPSKIDIGPVNTLVSHNDLEKYRFRLGGMTTAALWRRVFISGYGAWATGDHRWKYKAQVEYSFNDKKVHPREFPVHSISVSSLYDVDRIGQHYLFTNPDNFVLSWKREKDTRMTYHHVNELTYTLELHNNFSIKATIGHERQQQSPYLKFIDGYGRNYDHYDETSLTLVVRYAPGEKFFQTRSQRIPVNKDAPVFQLSHTIAPRGWLGNMFTINRTEVSAMKRFWFSAFGFTDIIIKGGHVWSRTPYPNMLIPNANLSYTIQPESFALMNAMEFINDSYVSWDVTYWGNGAIFNYIPLVKKLRLREVFACRGLWGHLSDRNKPWLNPSLFKFPDGTSPVEMASTPYIEVSAGIDNLFKIFRLDYVWRLTYRHNPGIDRSGLRVALHITF